MVMKYNGNFGWDSISVLAYKDREGPFKDVTRQIRFEAQLELSCQVRYFEVGAGGHSTLERHRHAHFVVVIRGEGEALIGDQIHQLLDKDVVLVPSNSWHQFRATQGKPLGFLGIVNGERDKPVLPTPEELGMMRRSSDVAAFIRA